MFMLNNLYEIHLPVMVVTFVQAVQSQTLFTVFDSVTWDHITACSTKFYNNNLVYACQRGKIMKLSSKVHHGTG